MRPSCSLRGLSRQEHCFLQEQPEGGASLEELIVKRRDNIASLHKQADKLRKESESALLQELKGSQALPIKEGDYVLRLAEKEAELERVRDATAALQEHKLRMQVFETFVADELMGHHQRASAMGATVTQLNEITQSAPLAAAGAAQSAAREARREEPSAADAASLHLLERLLTSHAAAGAPASPAARSSGDVADAGAAYGGGPAPSASRLVELVKSTLGSSAQGRQQAPRELPRAAERDDVVRGLLDLERRRDEEMHQVRGMLWTHAAADNEPIATPPPLAEAVADLQDVRQELEKRLQHIQQLRATGACCAAVPARLHRSLLPKTGQRSPPPS